MDVDFRATFATVDLLVRTKMQIIVPHTSGFTDNVFAIINGSFRRTEDTVAKNHVIFAKIRFGNGISLSIMYNLDVIVIMHLLP